MASFPISASACGKLILLGEHAVVFGAPALVLGVERRLVAKLVPTEGPATLRLGGVRCVASESGEEELARAFAALLAAEGGAPAVAVEVDGDLPAGVGMGFSAAAGVAIARAVEQLVRGDAHAGPVLGRAAAWEGVFHGNPSGVDTAAAFHGGCLRYRRGAPVEHLVAAADLHLCVGLTGTRSSTKEMVDGVARLRAERPPIVDDGVAAIRGLVERAIAALDGVDAPSLGQRMNDNQQILTDWGLTTPQIALLCQRARQDGALGVKLTGAGGGGAVVALLGMGPGGGETADAVLAGWRAAGFEGFAVSVQRSAGDATGRSTDGDGGARRAGAAEGAVRG